MEGRVIFGGAGIIILAAVCTVNAGKVFRTLGMDKVDLMKVRGYDARLEDAIAQSRGTDQSLRREPASP